MTIEIKFTNEFDFEDSSEGLKISGIAFEALGGMVESKKIKVSPKAMANIASTMRGVPLMVDHSKEVRDIVGKVEETNLDGEKVLYSATLLDDDIIQRVRRGLIRHVSAGLSSKDFEKMPDGWIKLNDGYARELSMVVFPAIKNSSIVPRFEFTEVEDNDLDELDATEVIEKLENYIMVKGALSMPGVNGLGVGDDANDLSPLQFSSEAEALVYFMGRGWNLADHKMMIEAMNELEELREERSTWLPLKAENDELKKRLFIVEKGWSWDDSYLEMSEGELQALWTGSQGGHRIRGVPGSGKTHEEIAAEKHEEELKFWEDKIFGATDLDGSTGLYRLQKEFKQNSRDRERVKR